MKAKLIALSFFVFASMITHAQQVVNIDVKAGMAYNGITQSDDFGMKPGFRVGVGVDFLINEYWSIRSSFLVVQKNVTKTSTKDYDISDINDDYPIGVITSNNEIEALYFQVPILATATLEINRLLSVSIGAGPYFAYGLSGDTKMSTRTMTYPNFQAGVPQYGTQYEPSHWDKSWSNEYKTFGDNGLKKFDYGLALSTELNIGKHFFVGVGAEYGLAKIQKNMPKSRGEQLTGINTKTVSPHRYGFEMHVGFRL